MSMDFSIHQEAWTYQEQEVAIQSFIDFPVTYQKKTKLP